MYEKDLQVLAAAEQQVNDQKRVEEQELVKQRMVKLDETGLKDVVSPDDYDFESAAKEQDFVPAEEGGYDLPNKFMSTAPLAGYDLKSGEQVYALDDPNGFGKAGFEAVRNGVTNTEHGVPSDVFNGYLMLALHGRENGMSIDDLDIPLDDDEKARIGYASSYIDFHMRREGQLKSLSRLEAVGKLPEEINTFSAPTEPESYEYPEVEEADIDREQLINTDFINAIQTIADHKVAMGSYSGQSIDQMSDEEIVNAGIQEMALVLSNETYMANIFAEMQSGKLDPETANAYRFALDSYDNLSMFDAEVMKGSVAGFATSPLTYLSAGIGKAFYQAAGKSGVRTLLKNSLNKYITSKTGQQVAKVSGAGAVAGAVEGGTWAAGEEITQQSVDIAGGMQEEFDFDKIRVNSAYGAFGGAVLGGALGGVITATPFEKLPDALRQMTDNLTNLGPVVPGSPRAMRGSVGTPEEKVVADKEVERITKLIRGDVQPEVPDMGTPSQTATFYSRLEKNLLGDDNTTGNLVQTFGKKTSSYDPNAILSKIDKWMEGSEKAGVPHISGYEIAGVGFRRWLTQKAESGEKVARDEIEDFLYANRPRINIGIHSADVELDANWQPIKGPYDLPLSQPGVLMTSEEAVDATSSIIANSIVTDRLARNVRVENVPVDSVPKDQFEILGAAEQMGIDSVPAFKDPITDEWTYLSPDMLGDDQSDVISNVVRASVRNKLKNLNQEELVMLANDIDKNMLLTPDSPKFIDRTINYDPETGTGPENYREMRLFVPFKQDARTIAADRWGPYDELDPKLQARADRTAEMAGDPAAYNETRHFPLEMNRLAHVRMQDAVDGAGNRILHINEFQSDVAQSWVRYSPDKKVGGPKVDKAVDNFYKVLKVDDSPSGQKHKESIENAIANYKEGTATLQDLNMQYRKVESYYDSKAKAAAQSGDASKARTFMKIREELHKNYNLARKAWLSESDNPNMPMVEGWQQAALQQIFSLAEKEGYQGVAFTSTKNQLMKVEGWDEKNAIPSLIKGYEKDLPKDLNKARSKKMYNIGEHKNQKLYSDNGEDITDLHDEPFNVYYLGKEKMTVRPLYGAVGAPGAMQLMNEEDDGKNI